MAAVWPVFVALCANFTFLPEILQVGRVDRVGAQDIFIGDKVLSKGLLVLRAGFCWEEISALSTFCCHRVLPLLWSASVFVQYLIDIDSQLLRLPLALQLS